MQVSGRHEIVFVHDRSPFGRVLRHLLRERQRLRRPHLHPERIGDRWPYFRPAENVAISDVEMLVAAGGSCPPPIPQWRQQNDTHPFGKIKWTAPKPKPPPRFPPESSRTGAPR